MNTTAQARILIFGLAPGDSDAELRQVLGQCGSPRLEFCAVPGDGAQSFAVVHLRRDPGLVWRLAERVARRRINGRRLQTWVPAMPWI